MHRQEIQEKMSEEVKNSGETTIRVLSFDGADESKFDEWYTKNWQLQESVDIERCC